MKESNITNLSQKKRVLLFADWFDPAYKAGGPIRSCVNFVLNMQDVLDIYILTSDRDLGATTSLDGIKTGCWVNYGEFAKVYYATPVELTWKKILAITNEVKPQFVYCNSLFSKYFTIYPLLYKRLNKINAAFVLSPRGMLKPSALAFKRKKKKIFLSFFKSMRIPNNTTFHATDNLEYECLKDEFGDKVKVSQIGNFPEFISNEVLINNKEAGKIKILFVGRIHPIKNLLLLLEALQNVKGEIDLVIVGMKEDEDYWKKCEEVIDRLPSSVSVNYLAEKPHYEIHKIIRDVHIFCLPTQGENFGHAIFEALAEGKPVIISDQTPWKNLGGEFAGFDIPLSVEQFSNAIQKAVNWNLAEYEIWSRGALAIAKKYVAQSNLKEKYLALFS